MEELSAVLDDDIITHLWDKPKKKLSNIQMATLRQACCSPFFIIHGPPGNCVIVFFTVTPTNYGIVMWFFP